MKILHLLNFYASSAAEDKVQRRTMECLQYAAAFAQSIGIDVSYLFVGGKDDVLYAESLLNSLAFSCKNRFIITPQNYSYPFLHGRTNPSLTDTFFGEETKSVLADLIQPGDSSLILISNTDICLRPHAYLGVALLNKRNDKASFVINRETLAAHLLEQPICDSFSTIGDQHPGHDFFCISPETYFSTDLEIGGHLVGFGFVMRPVLANLIFSANPFWEIQSSRLTFHYGDDMPWKNSKWDEAIQFNKQGMLSVYWRLYRSKFSVLNTDKKSMLEKFFPESLVGPCND